MDIFDVRYNFRLPTLISAPISLAILLRLLSPIPYRCFASSFPMLIGWINDFFSIFNFLIVASPFVFFYPTVIEKYFFIFRLYNKIKRNTLCYLKIIYIQKKSLYAHDIGKCRTNFKISYSLIIYRPQNHV